MISQDLIDRMLAEAVKGPLYVSAHNGDPTAEGVAELSDRKRTEATGAFTANKGGVIVTSRDIKIENLRAGEATYIAAWDSPTGGSIRFGGMVAEPRKLFDGDSLNIKAGMFGIRLEA